MSTITIHSIGHTTDGYRVVYTVHSHESKSRVSMTIPYDKIDHTGGNIEKMIRGYLVEQLNEKI